MPSVLALRFSAPASQESVVRLEQTSFRELTASASCEEQPGKVSSSRLLDDLRCSRPTTIDMMAIAGVHSTHPLHRVDADCVARVLQVWHGATEEIFSELDCCRLNGRSA